MRARVAEWVIPGGRRRTFRVDLHGVSVLGPGAQRTLIRWEWIKEISLPGSGGVAVLSPSAELLIPDGVFRLGSEALAARLLRARSITERPDVIGELAASNLEP